MDDPRNCENQLFYCLRPASMVAALGFVRISGTQCTVAWVQYYSYYRYSVIMQSLLVQRIRRWPCDNSVQQFPGLLGPKWGCSGIIYLRMASMAVLGLQYSVAVARKTERGRGLQLSMHYSMPVIYHTVGSAGALWA